MCMKFSFFIPMKSCEQKVNLTKSIMSTLWIQYTVRIMLYKKILKLTSLNTLYHHLYT